MAIAHDITSALAKPSTLVDGWQQLGDRAGWGPGVQVGPYRLKRPLGKGGMGVVWLAEQLQPLHRDVAIKVMASARRDPLAEVYFEIERQALAQLSHRAIAQIYDAGRLPDGALFFAMEFVPGLPLDDYQAEHPLTPRQLAQLFIQICQGVQHAHQRGLIHRDLKPLNILVQQVDGVALPKIIDFGIALGGSTIGTPLRIDRVVGTPAYMSPEQRRPDGRGIDARSDVYALGVVLAEAMCRPAGSAETVRRVDATVVRAAVLHELGVEKADIAAINSLLDRLKHCPRELLAITAKAMAPEREQRYETPAAMAEDLSRWLDSRPVQAMRQNWRYTLRCAIRRNRLASAAVAAVSLALLLGAGMALYGMTRAQNAQMLAEQRRNDAEKLIQFMLGDFADKLRPIGRLELLDSVSQQALDYLSTQDDSGDASTALSRARALRTVGEVQATRQQFEMAERALRAAAEQLDGVPAPGDRVGDFEWVLERGTINYWRGLIAYRRLDLAETGIYWRAYRDQALQLQQFGAQAIRAQTELASALNNLGTLASEQDQFDSARAYFQQAVALRRTLADGQGDSTKLDLANSMTWLASVQGALGLPVDAQRSNEEALAILQSTSGAADSRRRQREINLRYVLAIGARHLLDDDAAAKHLAIALELAQGDVVNDPTQIRRHLMLVKVAFEYARTQGVLAAEAMRAVALGEDALNRMDRNVVTAADMRDLTSLRLLARQAAGLSVQPEELATALDAYLSVLAVQQPEFVDVERATELWPALRGDGSRAADRFSRLRAALNGVADAQRQSLRYQIATLRLITATEDRERDQVIDRIATMRESKSDAKAKEEV